MSAYEEEPTLLLAPAPKLGTAMPAQTTGHGLEPEVIADAPAVINATTASQDALQSWLTSLNTRAPQGSATVKSLMAAAQPLLQGLPLLRGATACPNVQMLHHTLVQGLKQFNTDCQQLGLPNAQRISTRYMLCSALDEAVLSTPWGITSQWSHRALLSLFHHETTGGEKVFQVLAQLMQQPREHLPVLEVFYVCLAMGFEGQFKLMPHGQEKRARLRSELYTQCASYRAQAVGGGGGFCNRFLGGAHCPR